MEKVLDYIRSHRDAFVEELFEVLRIPSVSAQTEHRGDMVRCAEHLAAALVKAGADRAEVMPTEGNPVVYAEPGSSIPRPRRCWSTVTTT